MRLKGRAGTLPYWYFILNLHISEFLSSVVFSIFNFRWRGHFQELQLNNDLVDFCQIWPDARKTYNQQKGVGEFDNSKNSFLESHFRVFTPHGVPAVLKMFLLLNAIELRKTPTRSLSFWDPDLEKEKTNSQNITIALSWNS